MSHDQENPYGSDPNADEFVTRGEALRQVDQVIDRRVSSAYEAQAIWAEFTQRHPDLAQADQRWLLTVAGDLGNVHKDLYDKLHTREGRGHAYDMIADEARRRARTILQPPTVERQGGYRDYEPSDEDRAEAIREEAAQYYRAKQPPRERTG